MVVVKYEDLSAAFDYVSFAAPMEHQLPDARLLVVEGAGHTVNIEAAEVVNDRIRSFLREVGPEARQADRRTAG